MGVEDGSRSCKPWKQMTSEEKLEHRMGAWLNPAVSFANAEAAAAYRARVQRLIDVIRLEKTPDRVPVPLMHAEIYPLLRAGLLPHDGMYDFQRAGHCRALPGRPRSTGR